MSNNTVAEAKLAPHVDQKNGRSDINSLKNHYKGVGVHAINIIKADKVLNDLFYSGEKPPHMWWDKFERQLTDAFNAHDRHEGRMVHSEYQKLRILNRKVTADFLQATKASININLARIPITITYKNAGYRRSRQDARMVQCHDGTQIEVHPAYDFTSDEWQRLPEAERSRIREERT